MRAHPPQHLRIADGELPQPGTDRYPRWAGNDERRRKRPQTTHHTTPAAQPRKPITTPNEHPP
ncbi:hypothetical protein [Streptomyces sp. NPDC059781]|uniref:hypothetical protein n=1 Tax=Streptomyces sp. NPDC059781 TaxID=3346943 RepID=UPI00365CF2AB